MNLSCLHVARHLDRRSSELLFMLMILSLSPKLEI